MAWTDDVLTQAACWIDAGEKVALATVIHTWGSSPRPIGSQLAVTQTGRIAGSVSGGCIEGAVADAALDALRTGRAGMLRFGVTNERAWEFGLSCGGEVRVLVEPAPPRDVMDDLLAARRDRRTRILATNLESGSRRLLPDPIGDSGDLGDAARTCIATDRSQGVSLGDGEWFLHLHAPQPQLIIIGGVHIAQSLAAMARLTGADVVVCDPRPAYASTERFPQTRLRHLWPAEAIAIERPDRNSALVALSHDPKFDDPALEAALATDCGYIGALGSRRSHLSRLGRLAERGVSPAASARIMGPVGLDIRAMGAGEIAVSIMAEWIAHRRGAPLRCRT